MPKYGILRSRANCAVSTLPSKPRSPKPPGTRDAVDAGEDAFGALALDVLRFQPLQVDPRALADAAVLERLAHRLVGVLVVDVLADHGDRDFVDRVFGRIDHRVPFRQVGVG